MDFLSGNSFPNDYPNFPKHLLKFCKLYQNLKKTIIFVTKLVQNYYTDQNSANFSLKTLKLPFSLKSFIFQNFRRLRPRKFGVLYPKITDFIGVGVAPKNNLLDILSIPTERNLAIISSYLRSTEEGWGVRGEK